MIKIKLIVIVILYEKNLLIYLGLIKFIILMIKDLINIVNNVLNIIDFKRLDFFNKFVLYSVNIILNISVVLRSVMEVIFGKYIFKI